MNRHNPHPAVALIAVLVILVGLHLLTDEPLIEVGR